MANNVTLSVGTQDGAVAATDDVSSVHYQVVKLADGTEDASTRIAAGGGVEANALRVTIASDSTGVVSVDDGGGALTVDGTVTANLGATDNAVLDSIVTATQATQAAVEGTLTVAAHAVTNAGTFAVQVDGAALTALQTIDNSIFADDAAFTLTSSSVTMAGAIRDDALSTLTAVEGDAVPLRVNSTGALHVTGGGGGTEYAVDDALGATPTGSVTLATRDDALSTLTPVEGDAVALRTDANGALWVIPSGTVTVDGSGVTQPVSGTVTANLGATDNAVLDSIVTATQATQAAVEGTLTVGSHAVTNAGTFATQVNGAALTALQLIDNIVQVEDAVHGTGDSGVMSLAVRNDALAALAGTDGDYAPLQVNASGALFIQEGSALDVSAATVTVDNGGTFATQAAQSGTWNITNVSGTVSLPTGAATAAKQPALGTAGSAASDVISVQGIASMTALVVDGSAVTQPVSGTVTANLSATDNAVLDVIETNTSGNTSHYRNIDANAEAEIKGSAGTLKWLHAMNLTAAVAYVHLYDQVAASVTPGTTTPSYTFPLATQGDTNGAGFVLPAQIEFTTGITIVVTTTLDGSTGDPGTNGVIVNAGYA